MSTETLMLHELGRIPNKEKPSQTLTLYTNTLTNIELIKPLLLNHYTQEQIAQELNCTRETVNRIIAKWMQTDDFREWSQTLWLKQYNMFSRTEEKEVEAFKALTKLICAQTTRHTEIKADITETKTYNLNYSEEDKTAILNAYTRIRNKQDSGAPQSQSIH
jgi:hypothetical protein